MPLPLLPGLVNNADGDDDLHTEEPSGLTQLLDGLDDSDLQELLSAADQYHADNPDPVDDGAGDETDNPDALAEGDEDDAPPSSSKAGDTEPAPPPGDDDEDAPADDDNASNGDESASLDQVDAQLDEDVANAAHVLSQMQDLADGDSDAAPDVAKLVKQATALSDKIDKQRKLLDKALKSEDVQAGAQAGMDAQDSLTAMEKLLDAAQALGAKTEAPAMTASDHPAIKAWAAKVQGKKLGAPPAAAAAAPKPAFGK